MLDFKATNRVSKYDAWGNLLLQFSPTNQLNPGPGYSQITVGKDDRVYIADTSNRCVQVFDQNGFFAGKWTNGTVPYFSNLWGIATMPNGQIATLSAPTVYAGSYATNICIFNPDGTYAMSVPVSLQFLTNSGSIFCSHSLAATPDGLLFLFRYYLNTSAGIDVYDPTAGRSVFSASTKSNVSTNGVLSASAYSALGLPFSITNASGLACDLNGTLYITSTNCVFGLGRVYGLDPPLNPANVPVPYIIAAQQRSGTSLVDIDYMVGGGSSSMLTSALLAFFPGPAVTNVNTPWLITNYSLLDNLIVPTQFAEGTGTNLGVVWANVTNRVTWDASEAITNLANIQFEILANDGRGLLNLHFITIPTNGTNAALTMSSRPVKQSDLLNLWLWLIGTHDPQLPLPIRP